jgi:glycolate oxidase
MGVSLEEIEELRSALPDGVVVTDAAAVEKYRHDWSRDPAAGTPAAVVRVDDAEQVQTAVRWAAAHRVPVVPRGAGSGLSGGSSAVDGGIVLSLERMRSVEIDPLCQVAVVEPGAFNKDVKAAAAFEGLWYPPDPSSFEICSIGGNVATNAGGLCCVKYGVTRDALLGAEVVLADGRVVRVGRRTRKGVAGYDLAALLCGSEGTLGVITEVTLRLQPPPGPASTLAASFPTLEAAGEAIRQIARAARPSLLEVMDAATIAAVEAFQPMDLDPDAAALVFARSDEGGGTAEIAWMERTCEAAGAALVVTSDEEAEGRMLLAARRLAYPALERRGATLLDDVAVPVGAIPAFLAAVQAIAAAHGVLIATFGHAGDGNMHPTIVYDHHDADEVARARAAFAAIVRAALQLGGTITGEHGVGLLKRPYLVDEIGPDALDLSRDIKRVWDPDGRMNPGKML